MLLPCHDCRDIVFHGCNRFDVEFLDQDVGDVGRQERRQGRAEADVFDAQIEQREQHDHGLLLEPGDVIGNRQVVDVVQAEDLFELEGDYGQ